MFQSTLIHTVVVWDRILEVEESQRLATRYDDVFEPQSLPKKVELDPSTPLTYLIQRKEADFSNCCGAARKEAHAS
ncbi:MAG: hypothetical protein VB013_11770 [Anaerolineaceae bacterium]|nr:hypothetical protein [Anaerolineaceae bacterium]